MKQCSINQCTKPVNARGYCSMHYERWRIHGDPLIEIKPGTRHGLRHHPMYERWKNIRARCNNENYKPYKNYGGRGIYLSEEFDDPTKFIAYITGLKGYGEPGLSLDRIDNDRGYERGNLRWATRSEQRNNQRRKENW